MERQLEKMNGPDHPHAGLSGRELVEWALAVGEERCMEQIGHDSTQERYFRAVSRRAGVEWPAGFFASTVEDLMDSR